MVSRMMNAGKIVNSGLGTGGWCSTQFQDVEMVNAHEEICKALESSITGKKLRIRFWIALRRIRCGHELAQQ